MIKVTLYANPETTPAPTLNRTSLEKGIFDTHIGWNRDVALTDVGEVIWEIAKSMDSNASIGCKYTKWETGFIDIIIRTSALTILLTPKVTPPFKNFIIPPGGYKLALKIQFEGDIETIQFVVKKMLETLDYKPYEFKERWHYFQQTYNISRTEVVEKWKALLETTQPRGEIGAIYCTQCRKHLRADAKFCDQCGGKVE